MKTDIKEQEKQFQPVELKITFESEKELVLFKEFMSNLSELKIKSILKEYASNETKLVNDITLKLYEELRSYLYEQQ